MLKQLLAPTRRGAKHRIALPARPAVSLCAFIPCVLWCNSVDCKRIPASARNSTRCRRPGRPPRAPPPAPRGPSPNAIILTLTLFVFASKLALALCFHIHQQNRPLSRQVGAAPPLRLSCCPAAQERDPRRGADLRPLASLPAACLPCTRALVALASTPLHDGDAAHPTARRSRGRRRGRHPAESPGRVAWRCHGRRLLWRSAAAPRMPWRPHSSSRAAAGCRARNGIGGVPGRQAAAAFCRPVGRHCDYRAAAGYCARNGISGNRERHDAAAFCCPIGQPCASPAAAGCCARSSDSGVWWQDAAAFRSCRRPGSQCGVAARSCA